MVQFGPGITFSDMMEAFRSSGESIAEVWPWVPFSLDGTLRCSIMPLPQERGYEIILVQAAAPVRFPDDPAMAFRISGIEQHITVIEGNMTIEHAAGAVTIYEGESYTVDNNDLVAYSYDTGVFLFKQVPRVASELDFTFESLE
jgi:hypothetical protein